MITPERHVSKAGKISYKVRFRGPRTKGGFGPTSETFDSRKAAERFARLVHDLGPQGALDRLYEADQDNSIPTLDQLAADHIEHLTGVEPGTKKTYTRLWERTWSKQIGSTQAHRVTKDQIARAVNTLAETYSAKSLQNQRGLLAGVLDRGVELGYLPKNPAKGIRLPRGKEADRAEMRILSPAEYADVITRVPEHYRPLVDFLAGTGARWGEAVALTVADVQLPNVRIRRALKWSPDNDRQIGATKTKRSNRTVALPEQIHAGIRAACEGKARGDLVFTAPRGGAVLHRTFWSRVWLPAVSHLEPRPRIHDLRSSHASWLLAAGVPIHIVQRRLGHENISTTVDTYGHLLPDAQMVAAEAASHVFMGRADAPARIAAAPAEPLQ